MSVRGGPIKGKLMTLPGRKARFLKHFAKTGNQTESLAVAGLAKSTHYKLLDINPKYAAAFQEASDAATDALVKEARRRAVEGDVEPTGWYKGKPGGYVTRRSDVLLMFSIKALRPEYKDRFEISGSGGQPLQITLAAYGASEGQNKGYKEPSFPAKEEKKPEPRAAPAIEVEANDV